MEQIPGSRSSLVTAVHQKTQRRRLQEDPPEYRTLHEVPVTASRRRPPDFRRYNGRIPRSSQTFTVLPTKQVGATIIIAPGTSLRSLANVTSKAQQNGQICEERIRRARGPGAVAGYRAPREEIPYRPQSFTVPTANFYRTTHEGLPYPPRIFTVPLGKCPAKMSCKSSTNSVGSGLALYVEALLNVFVVYKQEQPVEKVVVGPVGGPKEARNKGKTLRKRRFQPLVQRLKRARRSFSTR